ncbi:MAG: hypothetical protein NTV81_04505 [Candidatus Komeilibacteria bacterium]|nr:hypothetical protein [Candidatus Komeilibacteria bacterium]
MNNRIGQLIIISFILGVIFLFPTELRAFMTSTHYRLWADDLNTTGGFASSTNYQVEYSAGQAVTGNATSSNYLLEGGFQSTEEIPILRFQISKNYIAFGVLDVGFVYQDSVTATTTTNGFFGYATSLYQDGPLTTGSANFAPVSDGAVSAGQEEYGIAVSGLDAVPVGDVPITNTLQTIAGHSGYYGAGAYPENRETTVTFKLSTTPTTAAGDYSQSVYFIATATF